MCALGGVWITLTGKPAFRGRGPSLNAQHCFPWEWTRNDKAWLKSGKWRWGTGSQAVPVSSCCLRGAVIVPVRADGWSCASSRWGGEQEWVGPYSCFLLVIQPIFPLFLHKHKCIAEWAPWKVLCFSLTHLRDFVYTSGLQGMWKSKHSLYSVVVL